MRKYVTLSDNLIKKVLLSYTYVAVWIFLSFTVTVIVYNKAEISPSTLYAIASVMENVPFINGSPQNTFVPGLIDLAIKRNNLIGGDDFKSGQTKMKSVLVDFLVGAGIKFVFSTANINCELQPIEDQAIGVAILLGLLWWKSVTATEAQLRDEIGLMFYICIFRTSSSIFGAGAGELFGAAVMSIRRAGMIASLILLLFLLTGGYYM